MSRIARYGHIPGLVVLALMLIFYFVNWQVEASLRDMVRIRVIANSDLPEDQLLKIKVRNAVLGELGPLMARADSKKDAEAILASEIGDIEDTAREALKAEGCDYEVKARLGRWGYPVNIMGGVIFPRGRYTALVLVIGKGSGHNWWGILYPQLCTVTGPASGEGVQFRLKVLELVKPGLVMHEEAK